MKVSLLDTDTISNLMKGYEWVRKKMDEYTEQFGAVNISVVTYYKIMNGLLFKDAKKQMKLFENFIAVNIIIPLDLSAAIVAANIEADLRKKREVIGHTDTLIAGTAVANNLQLVTNNTDHFKRVKGLEIANWVKQ